MKNENSVSSRVCAVVAEQSVELARAAIQRAAPVASLIEIRLDYLKDFDFNDVNSLRLLVEGKPLPVILTCRAVSEGGRQFVDDRVRLKLLVEGARLGADYCDIEATVYSEAARLRPDLERLIVSYHNFDCTPEDLQSIYEKLTALPAAIHKIAARARDITDSLEMLRLLERAGAEGKKLIATSMEEPGLITRILGPSLGSFLTYGTLAGSRGSAPGQLSCQQMVDLYRVGQLSPSTRITGIIGLPISHSASPAMHNRAFAALGLDFVYLPIEVNDLALFMNNAVRPETRRLNLPIEGFSVTIPHKARIVELLDEVDYTARAVGAVNTVVIRNGRATGYNTDVMGAIEPLENLIPLKGVSCAVVGAGGAARAVVYGLHARGARPIVFVRDPVKARPLTDQLGIAALPIEKLGSSGAEVIINTTPVGMRDHSEGQSAVEREAFSGCKVAYDLVYNPPDTKFLKDARAEGCKSIGGLEMLVRQAAAQFEMWTGNKAPVDLMRDAALDWLGI